VANFLDIPLTQVMYKAKVEATIDSNGRGTLLTEECLMHPDIQVQPKFYQSRLQFLST
jgi:hypothetical protein